MATKNYLDLTGLTQYTALLKTYISDHSGMVFVNTTAYWDAQISTPSVYGAIYIYTDHQKDDDNNDIAGIKIGDGNAYVPDLNFIDYKYDQHLSDTIHHITSAERSAWNNKVRCFVDDNDTEKLIFTTN